MSFSALNNLYYYRYCGCPTCVCLFVVFYHHVHLDPKIYSIARNRTTGTLPVRSRYGRGAVEVRSRFGRGTVEVRSRYGRGTVEVRSRCVIQCSVVAVRSRYSLGMLPVRSWYGILKVRSRLVFLYYSAEYYSAESSKVPLME